MGKGLENRVGLAWATVGMLAWGVYMHVHLVRWIEADFSGRDAASSM